MKHLRFLIYLCVVLSLQGCIEEVTVEALVGPTSGRLVVEGLITNEKKPHRVKLSRVTTALPENPPAVVSDASVSITDGTTTWPLLEYPQGSGSYWTDTIQGEPGATYTLMVRVGNATYHASDQMPQEIAFDPNDNYLQKYLGKGSPNYYVSGPLVLYGADAPARITYSLQQLPDSSMTYFSFPGVDPDNVVPTFSDNLQFAPGSVLRQTKYALSRQHYLFMRAVLLEVKYYGGFFGSTRGNVPTNLSEGALGFFGACAAHSRMARVE
ncbi:DUF4249 family protein [Fulvivirgaceae bacterium PWU4]|uniref:DUF4249 family protein n=1 Tax=Chryseosolibacter histidini TaxID=2782349 RepID=A0AAP2DGC8_9BACT|nr:DUF4249 family protein [Chryseosolibacter histidini]MBT1695851.1 DUF4249 family protein [Chryseosolibacter histidini]